MGFGFRIAPGVKVYPSSRGLGIGTYAGPVSYYTRVGGRSRGASVAAYQRQARVAERQQQILKFVQLDQELARICALHTEEFPQAQPPTRATTAAIDDRALRRSLEKNELQGVPLLARAERKAAKQQAAERIDSMIDGAHAKAEADRVARQAELDAGWQRLLANEPDTVLATLEQVFEDNEAPAAAISCNAARVDLLMRWPTLDEVVADRKTAQTPTGAWTHHKRPQTERDAHYLQAMASSALATVKEAFAAGPALEEAALLVFRGAHDPAFGDVVLEPLFAGVISREQLSRVNWQGISPPATLAAMPGARLGIKGRSSELRAVDVSDDPEAVATINQIALNLGLRSPYGKPEMLRSELPDNPIDEERVVSSDITELHGLEEASRAALAGVIERNDPDCVSKQSYLLLVDQSDGNRSLQVLSFDTEGDERLADILESFETYAPLAVGYTTPRGDRQMTLRLRDAGGQERCAAIAVGDGGVSELGVETPAPPEAEVCRAALVRSYQREGRK